MPEPTTVRAYAVGVCFLSACAPRSMEREQVEREINYRHPTGVGPWTVADEPFRTGEPNPFDAPRLRPSLAALVLMPERQVYGYNEATGRVEHHYVVIPGVPAKAQPSGSPIVHQAANKDTTSTGRKR